MTTPKSDDSIPIEIHQLVASFSSAKAFEDATDAVEDFGISRSQLNLLASHEAVRDKFGHRLTETGASPDDSAIPQAIFADRQTIATDKAVAVGLPAYIGGAAAGLAIVATGGALAAAAIVAALGAAAGAGIGTLLARAVSKHHADYLAGQLAQGKLLLSVEIHDPDQEAALTDILTRAGAEAVKTIKLTRYWDPALYQRAGLMPFMDPSLDGH